MNARNTYLMFLLMISYGNIAICQFVNKEDVEYIHSMIDKISDTSFEACSCWFELHPHSSILPTHRKGIEYAKLVENKIDSSFSECSTISKNDSLFLYLNAKDMVRIKTIYEEWFMLWKKNTTIQRRPLDGTEYKWEVFEEHGS